LSDQFDFLKIPSVTYDNDQKVFINIFGKQNVLYATETSKLKLKKNFEMKFLPSTTPVDHQLIGEHKMVSSVSPDEDEINIYVLLVIFVSFFILILIFIFVYKRRRNSSETPVTTPVVDRSLIGKLKLSNKVLGKGSNGTGNESSFNKNSKLYLKETSREEKWQSKEC
jgi:hypothetical protein